MKTIIFLFFILCLFASCEIETNIMVVNNSNHNIQCFYSCDTLLDNISFFRNGYFPDKFKDSIFVTSSNFVQKDSSQDFIEFGPNSWKNYIKQCNNQVYFFYFYDSVINNNSNQDLISKKMYIKRVKYTLEDLEKSNWTVTYP